LEESVLGVERRLDVPGWLIPSIYFQYVRERDAGPLRPVFAHNEQDVLSLLALTIRLGRQLSEPTGIAEPVDLYSTGRVFEGAEAWDRAIVCYEQALAGHLPSKVREQASCRLGIVYKRLRRSANAAEVWRTLVQRPDCLGLLPYVELAKHLEHRERDYSAALGVVEQALGTLARRPVAPWQGEQDGRQREELLRRKQRLQTKVARTGTNGSPVM
jgi:hypothetical protein